MAGLPCRLCPQTGLDKRLIQIPNRNGAPFFEHAVVINRIGTIPMTEHRLYEFVESMEQSVHDIQAKINRYIPDELETVIVMDGKGKPDALVRECYPPSGTGSRNRLEMLRIPWENHHQEPLVTISRVSVHVNCRLKKAPENTHADEPDLLFIPVGKSGSDADDSHHLEVSACADENTTHLSINNKRIDNKTALDFFESRSGKGSDLNSPQAEKRKKHKVVLMIPLLAGILFCIWYFWAIFKWQ